jgi:hypothetical protein
MTVTATGLRFKRCANACENEDPNILKHDFAWENWSINLTIMSRSKTNQAVVGGFQQQNMRF